MDKERDPMKLLCVEDNNGERIAKFDDRTIESGNRPA